MYCTVCNLQIGHAFISKRPRRPTGLHWIHVRLYLPRISSGCLRSWTKVVGTFTCVNIINLHNPLTVWSIRDRNVGAEPCTFYICQAQMNFSLSAKMIRWNFLFAVGTDRCVPGLCYVVIWRGRETPKLPCNQHAGSAEDWHTLACYYVGWLSVTDIWRRLNLGSLTSYATQLLPQLRGVWFQGNWYVVCRFRVLTER